MFLLICSFRVARSEVSDWKPPSVIRPAESFSGAWRKNKNGTHNDVTKTAIVIAAGVVGTLL